jgi:hypothetical protein
MVIGLVSALGLADLGAEKDHIVEVVLQFATAGAGALAVYGRVKATKRVTK